MAAGPWETQDPRSSSTQSLVPSLHNEQNERRKLLLIYIHGFMGNETSFRSFPAHVHHLLTVLLAETHVVHTKVYPRYRSKRNISFARDDFSRWLEPHEDRKTDVVLLGHSMGGLLAAEVVLMPPAPPASRPLKHRILGSVNFDVPFLGMHPGVIRSGLASLFSPAEEPRDEVVMPEVTPVTSHDGMSPISPSVSSRSDALWAPDRNDPNYNTPFPNDVRLPTRQGWQNAWHFVNKHSGELYKATTKLVSSHMEFGGAMANYGELKTRYARVRALEEVDGAIRKSVVQANSTPPRARFINYYTASTGRPKKDKLTKDDSMVNTDQRKGSPRSKPTTANQSQTSLTTTRLSVDQAHSAVTEEPSQAGLSALSSSTNMPGEHRTKDSSRSPSPRISLEEHKDDGTVLRDLEPEPYEGDGDEDWNDAAETLTIDDSNTVAEGDSSVTSPIETESAAESESLASSLSRSYSLPSIPDLPTVPPPLDVSYISDPATRKLVEKEHVRAVKAYDKAIKDRRKTIADRAKLEEKHKQNAGKYAEKARKGAIKAEQKAETERVKAEKKAGSERAKQTAKVAKMEAKTSAGKELTQSEQEELRLERERQRMEAEGRRMRGEPDEPPQQLPTDENDDIDDAASGTETIVYSSDDDLHSGSRAPTWSTSETDVTANSKATEPSAPLKDRKFCMLPPKDSHGERDPCWVRIFMRNVDEVGAHCGLFFVDERYERLVGDVAERIEGWVKEEASEEAARRAKLWFLWFPTSSALQLLSQRPITPGQRSGKIASSGNRTSPAGGETLMLNSSVLKEPS
ncbi:hypothetical protein LTR35_008941 [Friedmanniomyces endolithicus]|uniref:AB hydrolase-1 domain-containing protein n=1 Tax=Friedmanniomyces endolithicus TaxID=329885 RepID=A0AAN6JEE2_9PEZI|nr:hypothetical protein LTR35_008941 [Friedmanniomyces endolithicus]KAK0295489.1 hypothetical protein LTS00_006120 [Friedmanniomyces endolithicus]KAK0327103.1 hypothetical protein LTR82_001865 [Friedmanniomyces endolithicus]KAK1016446.1 hypothetical protein LTR54_003124 [Friedmanniomyces endolithicus]